MAALDFPANPTDGQEYEFPPFTYKWDGEKWKTIKTGDGGTGSSVYVQDTAPSGALPGSLWYCTTNGFTYILYQDTDSTQWVDSSPSGGSSGDSSSGEYLPITGGTVTGTLTVSTGAVTAQMTLNTEGIAEGGGGNIIEGTRAGVREWYVGNGGETEVNVALSNLVSGGYIVLHENGETQIATPVSHSAQGTTPASLVRKDYLDGGFVPKSNGASEYANQLTPTNKSWGEQTDKFRTGTTNAPVGSGRAEFCDWIQWGHNGGQKIRHTLWCPADNSKPSELWYATQNNTTDTDGPATHWRVYHQGFAPTALDVGAASIDRVDTLETELRTIIKELQAEIELLKKSGGK